MSETHPGRTRSYRPGEWFAVFGDHATVLLPPSEKHRVAALWELVDGGAGFDEVLDALLDTGLRGLPGFVLVSEADGRTRIVIRGDARATFTTAEGPVEVDGSRAATWVERTLPGVTAMTIEVAETEAGDLAVAGGLVRLGRFDEPPFAPEPPEPPEPVAEPAPPEAPDITDLPTGPFPAPDRPIWEPPAPAGGPVADHEHDHDHDGMTTVGGWDPQQLARQQPGIPGQPPAPSVTARPVARLLFSTGEDLPVDRAIVVGRAPEARGSGATEQPRLVTVHSPNQEISSTHLEIRPGSGADHGSAVVTDLGSTNGTILVQPGLPPEELTAGSAVQLIPGAVLDLGDGVSIQVAGP